MFKRLNVTVFPLATPSKHIPAVVEAIKKKDYSIEINKGDISFMCQHSGGEEETEVVPILSYHIAG